MDRHAALPYIPLLNTLRVSKSSPSPAPPQQHRFEVLDSWRGILALAVALMHCQLVVYFPGTGWMGTASMAVDFFFVLSGFVIAHSLRRGLNSMEEVKSFVMRRFWRLWPLHMATLGIIFLVKAQSTLGILLDHLDKPIPFTQWMYSPGSLGLNLMLIQGFFENSWNFPSWSISVEFWTYLVAAATVVMLARRSVMGAAGLSLAALAFIVLTGTGDNFIRCLFGFNLGVVLYSLRKDIPVTVGSSAAGAEVLAAAMILLVPLLLKPTPLVSIAALTFVWPIAVFAEGSGPISAFLRRPFWLYLGSLSYSIYLVHQPMLEVFGHWLQLAERGAFKAIGSACAPTYQNYVSKAPQDCGASDVAILMLALALYISLVVGAASLTYRYAETKWRSTKV